MKRKSRFISALLYLLIMPSLNTTPIEMPNNSLMNTITLTTTALFQSLYKKSRKIVEALFGNDIPKLIELSDRFKNEPGKATQLANFLSYKVEGEPILPNEEKLIPLHKDRPFVLSISTQPGKLAPLVAFIKTQVCKIQKETLLDKLKYAALKLLDFAKWKFTVECPFEEGDCQEYYLADIVCSHEEFRNLFNNPTPKTLLGMMRKERLSWPHWLEVNIQLPGLKRKSL